MNLTCKHIFVYKFKFNSYHVCFLEIFQEFVFSMLLDYSSKYFSNQWMEIKFKTF